MKHQGWSFGDWIGGGVLILLIAALGALGGYLFGGSRAGFLMFVILPACVVWAVSRLIGGRSEARDKKDR